MVTPEPMTTPAGPPPEAITAAREATDRALDALAGRSGLSLAAQRDYLLRAALEAAAPHLEAAERERCAQLAEAHATQPTWAASLSGDAALRLLAAKLREQP